MQRSRSLQRSRMIPIREQTTPAIENTIDGPRHPHTQPLQTARQRPTIARLGNQMQMIALHGKVHETKTKTLPSLGKSIPYLVKEPLPAQRRQARDDAQSDMHGMPMRQRRTAQVRNPRRAPLWRAAGSPTLPTPGAKRQRELSSASHAT